MQFKISPHLVQDLGLNLYTDLPRVLVEFIANAYDADADGVTITIDKDAIDRERRIFRAKWMANIETAKANGKTEKEELGSQSLSPSLTIVITDSGYGMSRDDIQHKYLVVGRRRREGEPAYTPKGRLVMGRKGLGKLAGFGVAHTVTVTSRPPHSDHATEIKLNYEDLIKSRTTDLITIPERQVSGQSSVYPSGTQIELSRLVYEPMKSNLDTVTKHIGDYFYGIDPADFSITVNGEPVSTTTREFVFAWPPGKHVDDLIDHEYNTDDGDRIKIQFRIRFTGEGQHLAARERGVRVYAHKRLAAAPDLLDLKTGIHGFRNTHYMDAVLVADAIDDRPNDYISTDRQSLRWETSLLAPLRVFLTEKMEEACIEYQKQRDANAKQHVEQDAFTNRILSDAKLPSHRKRLAKKFATALAANCEGGVSGTDYRTHFEIFVDGLREGDLFRSLTNLASKAHPDFQAVVRKAIELTQHEFGDFVKIAEARLEGIRALEKICKDVDFSANHNEKELQRLLEKCPWLINPTYSHFLSANQQKTVVFKKLEEHLDINIDLSSKSKKTNPRDDDDERPDLTFVLGNESLRKLVVVELKAPNKPLESKDLDQLLAYMNDGSDFLRQKTGMEWIVEGILIGSKIQGSSARGVKALNNRMKERGPESRWMVCDILQLLTSTQKAHQDLCDHYNERANESTGDDD